MSPRSYSTKLEGLHIEIAGRWSAEDMAVFLHDLSVLYDIRHSLDVEPGLLRYARRHGSSRVSWGLEPWWGWWPGPPGPGLEVQRIKYSSPGYIELRGLGEAVKQIRLLLKELICFKETRREARLKNDKREQDVQAKMIENAREFLKLKADAYERELGDDGAIVQLATVIEGAQERILRQIERGNVSAIGSGSKESMEDK